MQHRNRILEGRQAILRLEIQQSWWAMGGLGEKQALLLKQIVTGQWDKALRNM